jgi:hypothetical protein
MLTSMFLFEPTIFLWYMGKCSYPYEIETLTEPYKYIEIVFATIYDISMIFHISVEEVRRLFQTTFPLF